MGLTRPVIRLGARSDDRAKSLTLKVVYYVYILQLKNGDLYKGCTSDLKRRIEEHTLGRVASTKNFRPFKLIGYEAYLVKSDATRREKFIKSTEGMRFLKQQYRDILNGSSG